MVYLRILCGFYWIFRNGWKFYLFLFSKSNFNLSKWEFIFQRNLSGEKFLSHNLGSDNSENLPLNAPLLLLLLQNWLFQVHERCTISLASLEPKVSARKCARLPVVHNQAFANFYNRHRQWFHRTIKHFKKLGSFWLPNDPELFKSWSGTIHVFF